MGHQTGTTTYPIKTNSTRVMLPRHTPKPREDETAVTGGFTARRTRARCAHVSQSVSQSVAAVRRRGRSGRTAAAV
eukprot:7379626-Prymnesium_polylepis.1